MTTRRMVLSAAMAGMAITGSGAALAAARLGPRPDEAIFQAIEAWRAAVAESDLTYEAWKVARERVIARQPPPLPDWNDWKVANHPRGNFNSAGPDGWRQRAVEAEMRAPGFKEMNKDEAFAVMLRHVKAQVDDIRAFYAEVLPAYEALQAERDAIIAAIQAEEGEGDFMDAYEAANDRRDELEKALIYLRPKTAVGLVAKVYALLAGPRGPDEAIREDEGCAIMSDFDALVAAGIVPEIGGAA